MDSHRLSRREFFRLVGALCRLHRVVFAPDLLHQQFPPDADGRNGVADLFDALDRLGLVADPVDLGAVRTAGELPCPAVLLTRVDATPVLALRAEGDELRCLSVAAEPPEVARLSSLEELRGQVRARGWSVRPTAESPNDVSPEPAADATTADVADRPTSRERFGFRWFVPELLRHRTVWRDVLAASLALQLVGLATPLLTQVVIDKVVVHQTTSTLAAVGVGLALALVFSAAFGWLRQYLVLHVGNRIDAVLGSRVFGHLLRLPLAYFAPRPTGTVVARLHGVETIREFVSGAAMTLLLDLPFMVVLLAVMFWYSWSLSLIALGLLLLLGLLSLAVTPLFRSRLERQFLLGARNQAFVTEYVAGMETVKSLQLEPQLERRYGSYLTGWLEASFGTRQLANSYHTTANLLEQAQSLAILIVGALLVMRGDGFTIGMLVAFQMFAGRLSQPLLRLVGLYQEFQQASLAVRRLGDLMDAPAEPHAVRPARIAPEQGRIDFAGVSFRHGPTHPWLFRHLDVTLRPGQLTLITGPSGCGKSTLARLLLGFHRPQDGRILLDGHDLRHLAANELRRNFGVVPQDTVLFAGTLYENLQLADPGADFEAIVAACKAAEIHAAIEALPGGYQTVIGEHGVGLSGGQKQRIAIARALLRKPRILVFDEATANLDAGTAEHVAQTINRLRGTATIVFIAHQVPHGLIVDEVVDLGAGPDSANEKRGRPAGEDGSE